MPALPRKATWRIAVVAAVLSLALAAAVAGAQEAPTTPTTPTTPASPVAGEVVVHPADGSEPIAIPLADVEGSIDTTYKIRFADGTEREVDITPENGASVDDVLRAADKESGYVYLEVPRDDGSTIRISRMRVRSGEGWGGRTPAIYVDAEGIHFVRPLMGPEDENGSDFVTAADGTLELTQTVSSSLTVEVTAKPRKVAAGEPVKLTAEVLEGGIGDRYEYSWSFGDGTKRGRGQTVEHEFEEAGRYRVEVEASNLDDFARGRTEVEVGKPKDGGPDREGGGSDEDGSTTGTYDGTGGGSSYDYGGGYDYGGSSYDSGSSSTAPDYSAPDYTPVPSTPATPAPPATSSEPTIAGNLLADVAAPPSRSAADAAAAARTGTPLEDPPDEAAGVPVAAWAGAGMLGLLLAGAGLESGRLRPLRLPSLRLPSLPRR